MKNTILKYSLLTFLWLAFSLPALADPNDPPTDDDPLPTPIDNWIPLVIMVGLALGTYFILKYNRKPTI